MIHDIKTRCTYHGRVGDDGNDFYPTFKQEAEMERRAFARDVIVNLETAESALFDAAQALRKYPGYENESQSIDLEIGRIEDLRTDMGGG